MSTIRKFRITVLLKDAPPQFSVIGYLDVMMPLPDAQSDADNIMVARDLIEYRQRAVDAFVYTEIHEIDENSVNLADFARN